MEALGLTEYERGIAAVEAAYNAGLKLVPDGSGVKLRPVVPDYDKEQAELVTELLRPSKKDIVSLTLDPQRTRRALSEAQDALSEANKWVGVQLDLWDRLEKIYRLLFPDDASCIRGEKGCRPDAVVCCKACEGVVRFEL